MISFIKRLLFENWYRKLISLIIAFILWYFIHQSLTVNKTVHGVPVRITHIPQGKTVEGMLENHILQQRLSIHVQGNKDALENLSAKDLEVVIDASDQPDQWIASIEKKNLVCSNAKVDIDKAISKMTPQDLIVKQTRLISEKITVHVTQPVGEPPKGYQFLDVWPYQLYLTVTGPENVIQKLKTKGLKLSFNLNEISKSQLDSLQGGDEISFIIPDSLKKLAIPQLSDQPIEIDDPQAKFLRIDFSRQEFLPISTLLPITTFFPPKHSTTINPDSYSISINNYIVKKNGIKVLAIPLYAYGTSRLFLDTVKDMIQITVIAAPKAERETLLWSAQFIYPQELENRYVSKYLSQQTGDTFDILPHMREEYLRNRFRRYMSRFRFYTEDKQKLNLKIELQADSISVLPSCNPSTLSNETRCAL